MVAYTSFSISSPRVCQKRVEEVWTINHPKCVLSCSTMRVCPRRDLRRKISGYLVLGHSSFSGIFHLSSLLPSPLSSFGWELQNNDSSSVDSWRSRWRDILQHWIPIGLSNVEGFSAGSAPRVCRRWSSLLGIILQVNLHLAHRVVPPIWLLTLMELPLLWLLITRRKPRPRRLQKTSLR